MWSSSDLSPAPSTRATDIPRDTALALASCRGRRRRRFFGLAQADVERVQIGALLHDIGKIGIPDAVLQKPGRLTDDEYSLVKLHPEIGRRILEGVQGFAPYLSAVELHHENHDGTGYPHGLERDQTPVDARIIHVADAYDAMTTDRPYRVGMTHEKAIGTILANAGTQFDPDIASAFAGLSVHENRDTEVPQVLQLC